MRNGDVFRKIGYVGVLILLICTGCSNDNLDNVSENKVNETNLTKENNVTNENEPDFDIHKIIESTDIKEFEASHSGYYVTFATEEGWESCVITNYPDDLDFGSFPDYQEMVEYGYVSIENSDVVYSIFIREDDKYFTIEYDAQTKTELSREGEWFLQEDQESFTNRLLNMMDEIIKK